MRRSIRLALVTAGALTLAITAVALAAPHSGKWSGRVLYDTKDATNGSKVNYGYAPNDKPSVVRFRVRKGGHKLTKLTVTVPMGSCGFRGPPAVSYSVPSAKIKGGKFKKTYAQNIDGLNGSPKATLKVRGTLSGSKGSGRLSVKVKGASCTDKFKFKLKH